MNITTIPPMPATNCPAWCERDHPADWALTVSDLSKSYEIPMNDGTVAHFGPASEQEMARLFEPLHVRTVGSIDLGGMESAQVDLQRGTEEDTQVYINAEGPMSAEQARTFAGMLLEAAAALEALHRG